MALPRHWQDGVHEGLQKWFVFFVFAHDSIEVAVVAGCYRDESGFMG